MKQKGLQYFLSILFLPTSNYMWNKATPPFFSFSVQYVSWYWVGRSVVPVFLYAVSMLIFQISASARAKLSITWKFIRNSRWVFPSDGFYLHPCHRFSQINVSPGSQVKKNVLGLPISFEGKTITCTVRTGLLTFFGLLQYYLSFFQDRVYVQQNGVDNVYNLGLILFRDLVSFLLIPFLVPHM